MKTDPPRGILLSRIMKPRTPMQIARHWLLHRGPRICVGTAAAAMLPLVLLGEEIPLLIASILAAVGISVLAVQEAIWGIQGWIVRKVDGVMDDLDEGMNGPPPPPDMQPHYAPGRAPINMASLGAMADRGAANFLKNLSPDLRQEMVRMLSDPDGKPGSGTQ